MISRRKFLITSRLAGILFLIAVFNTFIKQTIKQIISSIEYYFQSEINTAKTTEKIYIAV